MNVAVGLARLGISTTLSAGFATRTGPIRAALITAGPFAGLHLPLASPAGGTGPVALGGLALVVAGVALRLVIGAADAFGGSLLTAAVIHVSFNAAGAFVESAAGAIRYGATGVLTVGAVAVLSRLTATGWRAR